MLISMWYYAVFFISVSHHSSFNDSFNCTKVLLVQIYQYMLGLVQNLHNITTFLRNVSSGIELTIKYKYLHKGLRPYDKPSIWYVSLLTVNSTVVVLSKKLYGRSMSDSRQVACRATAWHVIAATATSNKHPPLMSIFITQFLSS